MRIESAETVQGAMIRREREGVRVLRARMAAGCMALAALAAAPACGGRSSLLLGDDATGATSSTGAAGVGGGGSAVSAASATTGSGGAPCVAAEEICNGVDDDCDGAIDESDPAAGQPCSTGQPGVCADGVTECVNAGLACTPLAMPSPETCDGLDDDCNGVADDGIVCPRRVFVTSQVYTGNLGGLAGADAKCQTLADAAGLGGTYKAWLSASTISAAERLTHVGAPYVLADGVTVVAKDWEHLVNTYGGGPPLAHAIDRTETMGPAPTQENFCGGVTPIPLVTTGTQWDGSLYAIGCMSGKCYTCDDWTTTAGAGLWGMASVTDNGWTHICEGVPGSCAHQAALYCFEQ